METILRESRLTYRLSSSVTAAQEETKAVARAAVVEAGKARTEAREARAEARRARTEAKAEAAEAKATTEALKEQLALFHTWLDSNQIPRAV
ncbi:hypothetical protein DFH09DRAFT_1342258 [Mycena vulgaris]|nr:hypothetical protein DFH09DRAFT_1342258 [Mycena vulgaris]